MPPVRPAHSRGSSSSLRVPHRSTSVATARHELERQLQGARVPADGLDDALLVLSELLGNAIRHGAPLPDGSVEAGWDLRAGEVEVTVTDGGAMTFPSAGVAAMSATQGRGLDIVRKIASSWGVSESGDEVTVWAVVPLAAQPREARTGHTGMASGAAGVDLRSRERSKPSMAPEGTSEDRPGTYRAASR